VKLSIAPCTVATVFLRKPLNQPLFVLPDSLHEVRRDARIERAVVFAGKDIDVELFSHWLPPVTPACFQRGLDSRQKHAGMTDGCRLFYRETQFSSPGSECCVIHKSLERRPKGLRFFVQPEFARASFPVRPSSQKSHTQLR